MDTAKRSKYARTEQLVEALYSMLAATFSGRAMQLVKQGLSDRNGMIAFWKDTRSFRQDWRSSQICFSSSGHLLTALIEDK